MSPRRRPRRRRWPLLLLLPLLLELALHAAAPLVQRAMLRPPAPPTPGSPLRLLCVGDSNTYGLHLPAGYGYPGQLQARLGRRYGAAVDVANRGVPGQNTAQVAAALPADLAATRPDLVLILAGVNDAWNTAAEERGPWGWIGSLRLVRLARVLLAGVTTAGPAPFAVRTDAGGEIVVDRGAGAERVNRGAAPGTRSDEGLEARVRAGLRAIVAICHDHGARPVLMTYPEFQGEHAHANAAARAASEELGVPLVDHERGFGEHFARDGYEALMFNDHHPNLAGYRLMAEDVESALEAAGLLPQPGEGASLPAGIAPPAPDTAPRLEALGDGRLEATGPPAWDYLLAVACPAPPGEGLRAGALRIPLLDDEILHLARLEPGFSGRFDASGRAELAVPERLREAAAGRPLAACLILLGPAGAATAETPSAVSEPVAVRF